MPYIYNENTDTISRQVESDITRKLDRATYLIQLAQFGKVPFDISSIDYVPDVTVIGSTESLRDKADRRIRNNYRRLKIALNLLVDNGLVNSYTLLRTGILNINWFIPAVSKRDIVPTKDIISRDSLHDIEYSTCMPKYTMIRRWFEYMPNVNIMHKHEYYRDKREAWNIYNSEGDNALLNYVYKYGVNRPTPKAPIKVMSVRDIQKEQNELIDRVTMRDKHNAEIKQISEDF